MSACSISRPDPQDLFNKIRDEFSNTVLMGGNVIPESNEWYVVSLHYAMAEEYSAISEQQWKERDPRYACCDNLVDMASKEGIFSRPALPAQGYVTITGIPGSALTQNLQVSFGDKDFIPAGPIPGVIPDSGKVVIRYEAVIPGADSNNVTSSTGTLTNPPEGVDPEVNLSGANLCGGTDSETCDQFRQRYLDRQAYKPNANLDWIKQKVLEWPCVTSVCELGEACCELNEQGIPICADTVQLYAIFADSFPCGIAPQCVLDEVNDWLFGVPRGSGNGQAPFGMCGEIRLLTGVEIDIVIDGLGCATPAQQSEAVSRIKDYVESRCPATSLQTRALETIIAQIIGDVSNFSVVSHIVKKPEQTQEELNLLAVLDLCGNVDAMCDVKLCLRNIELVNTDLTATGCL